MDVAFNQHSSHSRRHNRSLTNINQFSLAPLTSKLPLSDADYAEIPRHTSYIEGKSAPTTPSILSRSNSRVSLRKPSGKSNLPKSKSSTHLHGARKTRSGVTTPGPSPLRRSGIPNDLQISTFSEKDRNDSDWLLRAGALMANSARESKGQAWLVSRASSTSLTGQRDEEEEALEQELLREQNSRRTSRRGSVAATCDADDEFSPMTTRGSMIFGQRQTGSKPHSRFGSRMHSRKGSRAQLYTPGLVQDREGYFDQGEGANEVPTEPDFVDVEEDDGIDEEEEARKDEALVRKLTRTNSLGLGGWVEKMLGWNLFAVDEDGDEMEPDVLDEKTEDTELSSRPSRRNLHELPSPLVEDAVPPPQNEGAGGWQDAAWLLSVATKVIL